jgi:hypothetical protein
MPLSRSIATAPATGGLSSPSAPTSKRDRFSRWNSTSAYAGLPAGAQTGLPRGPHRSEPQDGGTPRVIVTDPIAVGHLLSMLRRAETLTIERTASPGAPPSEPQVSRIPLSGAVAALLYMDEQQQRVGTITALMSRGDRPLRTIPLQPAAPRVSAAKPGTAPVPSRPPAAIVAKTQGVCGWMGGDAGMSSISRLNGNLLLYLFKCPRLSGAYNDLSFVLVAPADRPGNARRPQLRMPEPLAEFQREASELLPNADFDPATMTLKTHVKGRAYSDCGTNTEWVWTGRDFALAHLTDMNDCAHITVEQWPVLYRTRRR